MPRLGAKVRAQPTTRFVNANDSVALHESVIHLKGSHDCHYKAFHYEMEIAVELSPVVADHSEPGSPGTEHQATMTTQPCETGSVFQDPQHIEHGKPSVIKSYCEQVGNHGKECIWLCMQRGRKWIAKDIKLEIENQPLGIYELRKQCGWWKRHSMFSVVGVKEIKVYTHSSFLMAWGEKRSY
jgi:hypothetical protein